MVGFGAQWDSEVITWLLSGSPVGPHADMSGLNGTGADMDSRIPYHPLYGALFTPHKSKVLKRPKLFVFLKTHLIPISVLVVAAFVLCKSA